MPADVRPANTRFHTQLGWLDSWHSFSFSEHFDPQNTHHGLLLVLNDDVLAPGGGFGTHPHRDMEIITYIVDGELSHRDSTGREATIKQNDVQRMSAGTGVVHSEYNNSDAPVHLLQIWLLPEADGLKPSYEDRTFSREEKTDRLRLIASHDGREDSTRINQDAKVYASLLSSGKSVELPLQARRHAWVQLVSGELDVNGTRLKKGDGAAISEESNLTLASVSGNDAAEFLLFDLA